MIQLLLAIIYFAFISLGLPDGLLGSAWPVMHGEFGVSVSYMGIVSMIISAGTIVSSIFSDRLTLKLGAGRITALSVGMTAAALFGFSISGSFIEICLWAVPYGLGAGSVDAALNNYIALYYASRHMSWLHCMWGVGASIGPYIMGYVLAGGQGWNMGYRYVSILQIVLTAIILISLPLWKKRAAEAQAEGDAPKKAMSIRQVFRIPGAREIMLTFFCYCALEATTGLWSASYLVMYSGVSPEEAARFASLFYLGITAGRAISGFVTLAMSDKNMIRLGELIVLLGVAAVILPIHETVAKAGLVLIGFGCAPIYPCIIHSTPGHFGAHRTQAIIGVQMACAYTGTCVMPPLFGLIAQHVNIALFPVYLLLMLAIMTAMHERMLLKRKAEDSTADAEA